MGAVTSFWPVVALGDDAGAVVTAVAATAAVAPPATGLVSTIINTVLLPLLTAFGAWMVHKVVTTFEEKVGIQLSQDKYNQLNDIVDHGIHYAAEQAAKAGQKGLESNVKLKLASDFINSSVTKWGLDGMAADKIQALVEARLSMAKAEKKPV